jgi:uroporphyrinogen-III synthase
VSVKAKHHVVITRPAGPYAGADKLARALREAGFEPFELPVLECRAVPLSQETRALLQELSGVEQVWLAFLSPSAVWVWSALASADPGIAKLTDKAHIAVQGSGTAAACRECFDRSAEFIPSVFVAEEFAKEFSLVVKQSQRVLVPQSADGRDLLAPMLRQRGVKAHSFSLYRLERSQPSMELMRQYEQLPDGDTTVIFMSPSAVRAAVELLGPSLATKRVISVGPITSQAVRESGLVVWQEAQEHSEAGVVRALQDGCGAG